MRIDAASGPDWYKDILIYQSHVKAFFDANNDGVGDFAGLTQKLDYIEDLGCTAIWLLPFYPSPLRDDGYDIADYRRINPAYGTMGDFRRFIREAHRRGIRVITELVINHTSDQHQWFRKARQARPGTVARDYYVWSDTDQKYLDTRIIFIDTETSNWTWDPEAQAYFWHRFYGHQPDLNFDNPRVLREIVSVLHHWLDSGVDGLRLDAVPYLVEREGTNNENLPETHQILKKIRHEVDSHFPGRMLLAEANQWPEDTLPYFGDGDECHMAFHFPLMPRMYMALAQQDRHPITDIIIQTPTIPDSCQWAIFLRNHDELTLEMVTDKERDYLWQTYAKERQMRINLGIRRRLAPLMDNDRRKIELMNALLLSMPGTPVIYYGDELGMGDNIYLGDRDSVRTPMQWSPDRNGGFSRAEPQKLFLPLIMDPVYGYEAVNVEAQQVDQSSLLNWMKRILAVRRQHPTFGRGTLQFLFPRNRKILAYLREGNGCPVLCVFNLGASAQAVELDLSAFKGRVPMELIGRSAFPPVGDLPYMLTLPAYGFFWFMLAEETALPDWYEPVPEPLPDFVTLLMPKGWSDLFAPPTRALLERSALSEFLRNQRWFALKQAESVSVTLDPVAELAHENEGTLLAQVLAHDRDRDSTERYFLPLACVWDEQQTQFGSPLLSYTVAKVRRKARVGALYDATRSDAFVHAVIESMRSSHIIDKGDHRIVFHGSQRLEALALAGDEPVERFGADQSNTSLAIGPHAIVKIYRKLATGIQPEIEISRFLTEQAGFDNTPAYLGSFEAIDADDHSTALGVAFERVLNQGNGWQYTVEWLQRFLNQEAIMHPVEAVDDRERFGMSLDVIANLGRRTGELHRALAIHTDDVAFAPEPVTPADLADWARAAHEQLERACALLEDRGAEHDALREMAQHALLRRDDIARRIDAAAHGPARSVKTRTHGDYHLGQVLIHENDVYVIDFEGEPARPLNERRAKTSPLRDIAGMLRSFEYAAHTIRMWARDEQVSDETAEDVTERWLAGAEGAFLSAYAEVMDPDGHVDVASEESRVLLDLFLVEKAAYEVFYEASNRPSWIEIPLAGLLRIAARISQAETNEQS